MRTKLPESEEAKPKGKRLSHPQNNHLTDPASRWANSIPDSDGLERARDILKRNRLNSIECHGLGLRGSTIY